jgi:hypothetical protein
MLVDLKEAILRANIEDLLYKKKYYDIIEEFVDTKMELHNYRKTILNDKIGKYLAEIDNIKDLLDDEKIDSYVILSDLSFDNKKQLQLSRQQKLTSLQEKMFEYYERNVEETSITNLLLETHKSISLTDLTNEQKVRLYSMINKKIDQNRINEEYTMLKDKIDQETDVVKLQNILEADIDNTKYISFEQKQEFSRIIQEKINILKREASYIRLLERISKETVITDLLDGKLYDTLIVDNNYIQEQKDKLRQTRIDRLSYLVNYYYDSLLKEINESRDIDKLVDDGYYDARIADVRIEYLKEDRNQENLHQIRIFRLNTLYRKKENENYDLLLNQINESNDVDMFEDGGYYDIKIQEISDNNLENGRSREKLHQIRRGKLDMIYGKNEDDIYDTLDDLIKNVDNIQEISDNSMIANDIK